MNSHQSKALPRAAGPLPEGGVSGKPVVGHNEYRCERFAELDKEIAQDESAKGRQRKRKRKRRKRVLPTGPVNEKVKRFVEQLKLTFPDRVKHRPRAFKKRVLYLVRIHMPPHPKPGGRPRKRFITEATEMYLQQKREVREGERETVNWTPIGVECIPGFRNIRSGSRRRTELGKLRNSVYARVKRKPRKRSVAHDVPPATEAADLDLSRFHTH